MPSTRSSGEGSIHTPMAATASMRIDWDPVAVPANDARRSTASAEPSLRFALMTRRRRGSLPVALRFEQARQRRQRRLDRSIVVDGTRRLEHDRVVAVGEEPRNFRAPQPAQRDDGGDTHAARGVLRERAEGYRVTDARQREAAGVPQVKRPCRRWRRASRQSARLPACSAIRPSASAAKKRTRGALSARSGTRFAAAGA